MTYFLDLTSCITWADTEREKESFTENFINYEFGHKSDYEKLCNFNYKYYLL